MTIGTTYPIYIYILSIHIYDISNQLSIWHISITHLITLMKPIKMYLFFKSIYIRLSRTTLT